MKFVFSFITYLIFLICSIVLSMSLLLLSVFFIDSLQSNESSDSPFECGFDPVQESRTPFSVQFFLVTIVFLIFDLEVVILLPLLFICFDSYKESLVWMSLICLILIGGLILEWWDHSLEWSQKNV